MFDKSYWQAAERFVADDATDAQLCEAPGCDAAGDFRAPKSPNDLRNYRHFCLQHVQEYNKAWDFYKGMSVDEIEKQRREDIVGWRQTWPLGFLRPGMEMDAGELKKHIYQRFYGGKAQHKAANTSAKNGLTSEEQNALSRMGLSWPVSMYEIKQRYRALVKKHHPDTVTEPAQKKAADEVIKLINRAYAVLKKKLRA